MRATLTKGQTAMAIIFAVIVIDQILKIWVKTSFYIGEDVEIFSWFHLRFIENPGMAFGMTLGSKLFLTLFRIVAVSLLVWYIVRLCKDCTAKKGYVACIALITAGAAGNIVDCVFYGEVFSSPYPPEYATFVPWGEGYGDLFHGMVVDMFYFPLFSFTWPEWLPLIGGKVFSFFDPVFNFADAAITIGFIILIFGYYRYLGGKKKNDKAEKSEEKLPIESESEEIRK